MKLIRQTYFYPYLMAGIGSVLLCSVPAHAYEWQKSTSVEATSAFHTNYELNEENTETLAATVGLRAQVSGASETSSIDFSGRLGTNEFTESEIDSTTVYGLSLGARNSGERSALSLLIDLSQAPTNETELLDSGVIADGETTTLLVSPTATYNFTERTSGLLGLDYEEKSYETDLLVDSTYGKAIIGLAHKLNPNHGFDIKLGYAEFEPDESEVTEISDVTLSYDWIPGDGIEIVVGVGYTEVVEPDDSEESGGNFGIKFNRRINEREMYGFEYANVYAASSIGAVREEDQFTANLIQDLSDRTTFTAILQMVSTEDDVDSLQASLRYDYIYTRDITLAGGINQKQTEGDASESSLSVFFTLLYTLN